MIKKYLVFLPFIASCNRLGQSNMETQVEAQAQSSEKERKLWLKLISLLKTALDLLKASGAIPVTTTHLCYEDFINNFHTLKKQFAACPYPALNGRCFRLLFQHYGISYFTLGEVENEESCRSLFNALKEYTDIDVNEKDASGFTPLNNAIDEDNLLAVKLLLSDPSIEVNKSDVCRGEPLYEIMDKMYKAIKEGDEIGRERSFEMFKALIKHKKFDPNKELYTNSAGLPIVCALKNLRISTDDNKYEYKYSIFKAIFDHPLIDFNKEVSFEGTLLHHLLLQTFRYPSYGVTLIKAILQKKDLDLSIKNKAHHTALDLGMVHKNPTIRDIFKDYCNKSGS